MPEYTNRLYVILHPNSALVASQLAPEQFAAHYRVGSTRYFAGRLIFAELDSGFRNPYFGIEEALANLKPHPDGRPKATKFVCSYRVLEHIDFKAIKRLHLADPAGHILSLDAGPYDKSHQAGFLRTFVEIDPLSMTVLTSFDMPAFGRYVTDPHNPRGAPKVFFTQVELDVDAFLAEYEKNPFIPAPVPTLHPAKLRDAAIVLRTQKDKGTKGLSLDNDFERIPLRHIRHGFVFAAADEMLFFPMPSEREIEEKNLAFYKAM